VLLRTKTYLNLREGKEREVEGKKLLGRPRRRRKDNMKMGFKYYVLKCEHDASGL